MTHLHFIFGHEVYVLTPSQIQAEHTKHLNFLAPLSNHRDVMLFLLAGAAVTAVLILCAWLKTTSLFQSIGELINKASIVAPDIIRATFGASLIASATHSSLFGPEIPLGGFQYGNLLRLVLLWAGILIFAGLGTRIIAAIAALIWLFAFATHGAYLLTYTNYLGEALALLFMPQQLLSLDHLLAKTKHSHDSKVERSSRWGMPVARLLFGFALMYTAISVKVLYPAEPLQVVNQYHLTNFFPFDPGFVVLGAGLTEILIAALYLLGLLQRLTTIVFVTFIVLSLFYFKEAVWPHYLLLGLGVGIFLHKPDAWSLDYLLFKPKTTGRDSKQRRAVAVS